MSVQFLSIPEYWKASALKILKFLLYKEVTKIERRGCINDNTVTPEDMATYSEFFTND